MATHEPTLMTPVQPDERILVMDVLRGFALLGIWLMNIEGQAGPLSASMSGLDPQLHGADRLVDWLVYVLVQGKFMTLFSLLFGMGFALMLQRAQARGGSGTGLYARRLLVLLGFGLVHALLVWAGDVLIAYSLVGLVLLLGFRNTPVQRLPKWAIGLLLAMVMLVVGGGLAMHAAAASPEGQELLREQARLAQATLADQRQAYGEGSFAQATAQRASDTAQMLGGLPFFGAMVLAMFLLGAWFVRSGVMRDTGAHLPLFRRLLWLGWLVGLPLMLLPALLHPTVDLYRMDLASMLAQAAVMLAGVLMCLGYAAAIVLAMHRPRWRTRLAWLAPAGRMALTNYIAQSLIATSVFYGYGLGWFEGLPRAWQPLFVLLLFALQVAFSHWWLARHRHGPLEWLWRVLTYGRRSLQPGAV